MKVIVCIMIVAWKSYSPAGDQSWNSSRQCKMFSRIGDQESAISDPGIWEQIIVTSMYFMKCYLNCVSSKIKIFLVSAILTIATLYTLYNTDFSIVL